MRLIAPIAVVLTVVLATMLVNEGRAAPSGQSPTLNDEELLIIPKKKLEQEVDQAIGNGKAMHQLQQILKHAETLPTKSPATPVTGPATATASAGGEAPAAKAAATTDVRILKEQVRAVAQTQNLARQLLAQAQAMHDDAKARKLLAQAKRIADSAAQQEWRLLNPPGTPMPTGPRHADMKLPTCGQLKSCSLLRKMANIMNQGLLNNDLDHNERLASEESTGFEGRRGRPAPPGQNGTPLRGTKFFSKPAVVHPSLANAEAKIKALRLAGQPNEAAALAQRVSTAKMLLKTAEGERAIARQKREAAAHATNPAMRDYLLKLAEEHERMAKEEIAKVSDTWGVPPSMLPPDLRPYAPAPPKIQPGGIKFNGARADGIALSLDVTGVEFDPANGRIVLLGKKSNVPFDLGVFADVLRLAVERAEPFFSLEPRNSKDWDNSVGIIAHRLERHFGSPQAVAARIRAVSGPPMRRGGYDYYYAPIDRVDAAAAAAVGFDDRVKLVFSPDWLRYTKLGWMLYLADVEIKAVATGFLDRDGTIVPAANWTFDDFDPAWVFHGGSEAGRANFELAPVTVPAAGGRIDLSQVRPRLYVTGRKFGTDEDTRPSASDRKLSRHFDRDWREYVAKVPEFGQLEMIYRAYVAARYLVRNHPGLAQRILAMPRLADSHLPPLLVRRPAVLKAVYQNGHLAQLPGTKGIYYSIDLGYSGGTEFKVFSGGTNGKGNVTVAAGDTGPVTAQFAWLDKTRSGKGTANPSWRVRGDDRAATIVFAGDTDRPLPNRWVQAGAAAVALVLSILGVLAVALRRLPWQRLAGRIVCPYCLARHRLLGSLELTADLATGGALVFAALLPVLTAVRNGAPTSPLMLAEASGLGIAFAMAVMGVGTVFRSVSPWIAGRSADWRPDPLPDLLLGGRLVMMMLLVSWLVLEHVGWLKIDIPALTQVAERIGPELGWPFHAALMLGGAALLLSLAASRLAPYALGTRPLAKLRSGNHVHRGAASA